MDEERLKALEAEVKGLHLIVKMILATIKVNMNVIDKLIAIQQGTDTPRQETMH